MHRAAGLRYAGQGYELEVAIDGAPQTLALLAGAFHAQYERTYGYREELPVEGVTWFLTLMRTGAAPGPRAGGAGRERTASSARKGEREAYFPETGVVATPVFERAGLRSGERVAGPALVEEPHTTTVVLPGDALLVDERLALVIDVGAGDGA